MYNVACNTRQKGTRDLSKWYDMCLLPSGAYEGGHWLGWSGGPHPTPTMQRGPWHATTSRAMRDGMGEVRWDWQPWRITQTWLEKVIRHVSAAVWRVRGQDSGHMPCGSRLNSQQKVSIVTDGNVCDAMELLNDDEGIAIVYGDAHIALTS